MIVFLIILSVILAAALGTAIYIIYLQQKKYNRLLTYTEAYITFMGNLYFAFKETHRKLTEVDRRGSFEADDEVGFVFKEIQTLIDNLYAFMSNYVNQEEKKEGN